MAYQFELLVLGVLAALGFGGLVTTWIADRAIRTVLGEAAERRAGRERPGVSILRPVKGLDEGLFENFECLMRQDYENFEILIGAADAGDPALAEARRFAAKYPNAPIRVLYCPRATGFNPKVSILEALAQAANNDWILISDSNVRVSPNYLSDMLNQTTDDNVGIVTNVLVGVGANSTGSRLEVLQLATFVARATLFAQVHLNHACVIGKSMLFKHSTLAKLGGWAPGRDVLAEDYVIGNAFHTAGYALRVAVHPVATFVPGWSLWRFVERHLRWAQMRRRVCLAAFGAELFLYPTPFLSALVLLGICWSAPKVLVSCAIAAILLRFVSDALLLRRLHARVPDAKLLALSFAKDFLTLAIWACAVFKRTIEWRGNRFTIGAGSRLEPVVAAADGEAVAETSTAAA